MSERAPTDKHDFVEAYRAANHMELAIIKIRLEQAGDIDVQVMRHVRRLRDLPEPLRFHP
ncbi:MAG: hypothetical protein HY560_12465 [Gemmatimonadetes bacterium]|nr:hypothetical protein [Gemmatimonadota bacterium]